MSNDMKWMLGSDFHIPYTNKRYMDLWFKVMKWYKPHVVDYLGDIDDQSCVSRYSEGTPDEVMNKIAGYAGQVKDFYTKTREMLPEADLFVALGNHDIRYEDYIAKKASALTGLITPETLWGLDSNGYNYIHYNDPPKHRFGDIHVHHGNAISKHAGQSVQADIESHGVSIIRGHSHRAGSFFKSYPLRNGGNGETLRGWEIGHMTDIKSEGMAYTSTHNWQPGFAIGYIEKTESQPDGWWPHIQFIQISEDYTCVVNGRRFVA